MQKLRAAPVKLNFCSSQFFALTFSFVGLILGPYILHKVDKAVGLNELNKKGKKMLKEYRKRPGGKKQIHADYHYMKHQLEKQWENSAHSAS
ncbi:unnamed protein product [Soboliphyme baturini]|uniref:Uncharacterized protein n=1 Tax=Soboliphyme baturini TaxID=241478 RepID=A0A183J459_9BILA|nr:unnamed protein product [Soboliphyme baturini]